ncbi:TetR/AcrR family transcriptional regulator [Kitasatospora sp. McL0602]|uniref:TetR/AcrR family transcriptional regulator n=1 Tax=Kitasatospora sp. McL0602 TaxID=3439530 RepID=UPI003F88D596
MPEANDSAHPRTTRTGGRIRSEDARAAVLAATADLIEEAGYGAVTMEGVAARAGVAKSTLYRWWKTRATLALDAYGQAVARRMPTPDTGSTAADLTAFVEELYRVVEHPFRVNALRGLMAEAQLDPAFAEQFRSWVRSRRAIVTDLLARGVAHGELTPGLDLEHAADLVFGPFWYRLLVGHTPLDPADAPAHVRTLLSGFAATPPGA